MPFYKTTGGKTRVAAQSELRDRRKSFPAAQPR
jgi:hypothetical protein